MKKIPEDRLAEVQRRYLLPQTTATIEREVAAEYGVTRRAVRRCIALVRKRLAAQIFTDDLNADRARVESMLLQAFNSAAVGGKLGPDAKGMTLAARTYAEVTGVLGPRKIEHSGPGGGPIQTAAVVSVIELPALDPEPAAPSSVGAEPGTANTVPRQSSP